MGNYDPVWVQEYYIKNKARIDANNRVNFSKPEVKARVKEYGKKWRQVNKERRYWNYIWNTYKLTKINWEEIYAKQNGLCTICGQAPIPPHRLAVDHDHSTGAIRGLLCRNCNCIIGH